MTTPPSAPSGRPARRPSPLVRFRLVPSPKSPPSPSPAADARPAPAHTGVQARVRRWRDADILLALATLWMVSVVRVAGAAQRHEVFGAEATLAFISMFAIPWLIVKARLARGPAAASGRGSAAGDAGPHARAKRELGPFVAASVHAPLRLVSRK
jgi:hypothetical protein